MMDDDFSSLLLRKRKREKIERSIFRVFNPIVFEKTKEASALSLSGAFFHIDEFVIKSRMLGELSERAYHRHFFCALERKETSLLRKMEIPRARRRRRIKRR